MKLNLSLYRKVVNSEAIQLNAKQFLEDMEDYLSNSIYDNTSVEPKDVFCVYENNKEVLVCGLIIEDDMLDELKNWVFTRNELILKRGNPKLSTWKIGTMPQYMFNFRRKR